MLKISFKYMWRFGKYYNVISSEITWYPYNLKKTFSYFFFQLNISEYLFFYFWQKSTNRVFLLTFLFHLSMFFKPAYLLVFRWFPLGFKLTFSCVAYLFLAFKYLVYFCQDKVLWSSYLYFYEFYGDIKRLHITS